VEAFVFIPIFGTEVRMTETDVQEGLLVLLTIACSAAMVVLAVHV